VENSQTTFIYDVCWCLENSWLLGLGFKIEPIKKRVKEGKGRPRKKYPIEKMQKLHDQGSSYGQISRELNTPKTTVYKLLKNRSVS